MEYKFSKNNDIFISGLRDGIPISLGYLSVAFSLGIAAVRAGLSPFQSLIASFLNNASAGEYAGFSLIAVNAPYIEIALITLIANARYLLMSIALSQRLKKDTPLHHILIIAHFLTDEIFAVTIARPGEVTPYYTFGVILVASPAWALGTFFGAVAGNVLPVKLVSAFGVALYGMFIAIIIPAAKSDKVIFSLVIISFILSYIFSLPNVILHLSEGMRTILLTVIISSAAAILFPLKNNGETNE